MWDGGSAHGVLFLSHQPRLVAKRLVPWDVCAAFVDMLRCLAYAHHARAYYKGWVTELERASGVLPCGVRVAAHGNRAQCEWTASTYSNYAWMCLAARAIERTYGDVLDKAGRRALAWFASNVPFAEPAKVVLPTVFPTPVGSHLGTPDTHRDATRAARRYYRSLQGGRASKAPRRSQNKVTS